MRKGHCLWAFLVICFLSILLTSCGRTTERANTINWDLASKEIEILKAKKPENSPETANRRNDTVIIGTSEINGVFNPLFSETASDVNVTNLLFDGMVEGDYNGLPIPGMADFEISPDGLTYSFTLKEGINFSDGTPLTTEDVEFTVYVLCDPEYDGPYDGASIGIMGFEEYYNGNAQVISGIERVDERTIRFTLEKPKGQAIWFFGTGILSKSYYGRNFAKGNMASIKALNDQPMGSGQYMLSELRLGESINLTANESYWKGTPKINNLIFSLTPLGQEVERVITGEADIDFPAVSEDTVKSAIDGEFIDIYRYPTNGYGYVGMNLNDAKYRDSKVRQALVYGLNRQAAVEAVFGPYAKVINIPQSRVSWVYNEEGINPYNYDPEKAQALLKEAGWEKDDAGTLTKDGEAYQITFSTMEGNPFTDVLIPVMKENYEELGIEIEFEYLDFLTLIERVLSGKGDMWFLAWDLTPDPDDGSYQTEGAQNFFGYSNPEADLLWEEGAGEIDPVKRKETYGKIYRLLNNDVPCIWMYQRSDMWVVNSRIQEFRVSPYRSWTYDVWQMMIQ